MPEKKQTLSKMTYEEAFSELERIVDQLEGEQASLDELLALFERGQALAQHCSALLDNAELRIRQINTDSPTGNGSPQETQ